MMDLQDGGTMVFGPGSRASGALPQDPGLEERVARPHGVRRQQQSGALTRAGAPDYPLITDPGGAIKRRLRGAARCARSPSPPWRPLAMAAGRTARRERACDPVSTACALPTATANPGPLALNRQPGPCGIRVPPALQRLPGLVGSVLQQGGRGIQLLLHQGQFEIGGGAGLR